MSCSTPHQVDIADIPVRDRSHRAGRAQRGLSLIELLIVVCIAGVLLGLGLPSFEASAARRHVEGATAQLETELQFARSLAVARNQAVRVGFERQGGVSCYVIHTGSAQDCRCLPGAAPACRPGAEALRTQVFGASAPLSVTSNSPSIAYWPHNGTVTPTATVSVKHRQGESAQLVVNIMGRVRACSDTPGLGGYPRC